MGKFKRKSLIAMIVFTFMVFCSMPAMQAEAASGLKVDVITGEPTEYDEEIMDCYYKVEAEVGDTVTLGVSATSDLGEIEYAWFTGNLETDLEFIDGAENNTYSVKKVTKDRRIGCRVKSGSATEWVYFWIDVTNEFVHEYTLTSDTGEAVDGDELTRNVVVPYGEQVTLNVIATSNGGEITYTWWGDDETELEEVTGSSYQITGDGSTYDYYTCVVRDEKGYIGTVYFEIIVNSGLRAEIDGENRVTVKYGQSAVLKVKASSTTGELRYQWYTGDTGNKITGATQSSYKVTANGKLSKSYRCVVSDGLTSETMRFWVTVDTELKATGNNGTYEEYESGNEEIYGRYRVVGTRGEEVTLGVTATSKTGTYTYQWYNGTREDFEFDDADLEMEMKIDGATSAKYKAKIGSYSHLCCKISDGINVVFVEFYVRAGCNLSDYEVKLEKNTYTFTGKAIKPAVTLKAKESASGDDVLVQGTHYDVTYENNVKAGTAKVIITGKGNYTGKCVKNFTIKPKSISTASVTLNSDTYTFDGKSKKPTVKSVKLDSKTLKQGTHYTVSYKNNTTAGTGSVVIKGTGNYTGTVTKNFTIKKKSISKTSVVLSASTCYYNGKTQKPAVKSVKLDGKTLKEGTHYTVSYEKNKNIGSATVIIKGTRNYTGSVTKTFKIKAKKGTTFTVGANKYEITSSVSVAFVGLKSNSTKTVSIPKTVKYGGATFDVTKIADKALKNKTKVTSVTLGSNVKIIGKEAFNGCSKLSSITIKSTKMTTIGKNAFKGIKSTAKIDVPNKKISAYKSLLKGKGQSSKVKIK